MPTLKEVAETRFREKNGVVVTQDLMRKSGLLRTMNFEQSSHGKQDKWDKFRKLPSGAWRQVNAGFANTEGSSLAGTIDLHPFGGIETADVLIADDEPGGITAYARRKAPGYVEGYGQKMAASLIYGTAVDGNAPMGLRQYAITNGRATPVYGSGTGSDYTCIIAVKWDPMGFTGLYNQENFSDGLFTPQILNGGQPKTITDADGNKFLGYEMSIQAMFGLKMLTPSNIAILTGVKNVNNYRPTASQIDDLLSSIQASANDGRSFVYMRGSMARMLGNLRGDPVAAAQDGGKVVRAITDWDGVPFIVDDNITQTENRAS